MFEASWRHYQWQHCSATWLGHIQIHVLDMLNLVNSTITWRKKKNKNPPKREKQGKKKTSTKLFECIPPSRQNHNHYPFPRPTPALQNLTFIFRSFHSHPNLYHQHRRQGFENFPQLAQQVPTKSNPQEMSINNANRLPSFQGRDLRTLVIYASWILASNHIRGFNLLNTKSSVKNGGFEEMQRNWFGTMVCLFQWKEFQCPFSKFIHFTPPLKCNHLQPLSSLASLQSMDWKCWCVQIHFGQKSTMQMTAYTINNHRRSTVAEKKAPVRRPLQARWTRARGTQKRWRGRAVWWEREKEEEVIFFWRKRYKRIWRVVVWICCDLGLEYHS